MRKYAIVKGNGMIYNKETEAVAVYFNLEEARSHLMEFIRKYGRMTIISLYYTDSVKMAI